ncbi:MAG: amino acid ABC transporter permease [Kiritimatiellae bacterium]|nr:amino acid ABC transporter permease [Kiritimatiellia bacterium]
MDWLATFLHAPWLPQLLEGTGVTLQLFCWTLVLSIPLSIPIALGRMSKFWPLRQLVNVYLLVIRGTPLMLQLIFVFFAPYYLSVYLVKLGLLSAPLQTPDRFTAAIFAFVINYAAYFSEIFRGGIESIPKGQYEAGQVLGFTRPQVFFRIVLPQVVKRVVPASANEVITLVKDTALAQVLGVLEVFTLAKKTASSSVSVMPLIAAGIIYFFLNWIVSWVFVRIEKKLDYYR